MKLQFVVITVLPFVGCGASGAHPLTGNGYEEFVCPAPIGKIVREDCSRSALQYEGASFQGSVGVGGVGASASYKESAIREADGLVAMLKEQRVQLCNDFNTCKLSVVEYRDDQRGLDDSFVSLLALKDKMAAMDAESAAKILKEIQEIRIRASTHAASPTPASPPSPYVAGPLSGDVFVLRSKANETCLDALEGTGEDASRNGASIQEKPCSGAESQRWVRWFYDLRGLDHIESPKRAPR